MRASLLAAITIAIAIGHGGDVSAQGFAIATSGFTCGSVAVSGAGNSVLGMMGTGILGNIGAAATSQAIYTGITPLVATAASITISEAPLTARFNADTLVGATAVAPALSGTPTVLLFYRVPGDVDYLSVATVLNAGVYRGTIPGAAIAESGIEYYVEGRFGPISILAPNALAPSLPRSLRTELIDFTPGNSLTTAARTYRMVSFGAEVTPNTPADVFVDDLGAQAINAWRLARFSPGANSYVEYSTRRRLISPDSRNRPRRSASP
jgi:hypothetical protein